MTKLRVKVRHATTPNDLLNNKVISLKAKGLFGYIQSKPDGWNFSVKNIAKQNKESLSAITSGIKELESFGYLERVKYQNEKGHWGIEYILHDIPIYENPTFENPIQENPILENYINNSKKDLSKKELSNKEEEESKKESESKIETKRLSSEKSTTTNKGLLNKEIEVNGINVLISNNDFGKHQDELPELVRQFSEYNEGKLMNDHIEKLGLANLSTFLGIKKARGIDTYQNLFKTAKSGSNMAQNAFLRTKCSDETEIKLIMMSFARYNSTKVGTIKDFTNHFKAFCNKMDKAKVKQLIKEELEFISLNK
jgi:hypothetical protein